jgi:hypothetical protein
VPWARAIDGIGVAQWQCTDCRRRFVLTFQPPQAFVPIYLDPAVRSVEPRPTGAADRAKNLKTPQPPPAIDFECRCGEALVAHSWMYGGTTVCTGCRRSVLVVLKYHVKDKVFLVRPEYPHTEE